MQNEYYSRTTSILLISFLELLERFSYYGMRGLIVLYAISETGLQLERTDALSYYGTFSALVSILLLPAGLISDFVFKQRKGVLIGGVIALIGYLSLQGNTFFAVTSAMILILIGTSFTKVNLTVLLGRCYRKTDSNRDLAFMFYYFAINIGAFIGVVGVGYLGEIYSWNYGFGLCAIAMLIFTVVFFSTQKKLNLVEINGENKERNELPNNLLILDEHLIGEKDLINDNEKTKGAPLVLIALIIIACAFYWETYDLANNEIFTLINAMPEIELFGIEIFKSIATAIPSYLTLIFLPLLTIIWYLKGVGSSLWKIATALILSGFGVVILGQISYSVSPDFLYIFLIMIIFGIGEILIAPIAMSYITRLSPVNFSSTIYSVFAMSTFIFGRVLESLFENFTVTALLTLMIGVAILIFRKKLVKLAGGLD
ncbi:MAG: POT family proton-dependent oligopeptide transporter [Saprospiraceae bacterium]|jgi:POT family proton-dependent oligopeptide transporter